MDKVKGKLAKRGEAWTPALEARAQFLPFSLVSTDPFSSALRVASCSQVIKIMSDSAGEPSDGLHLLRLAQLVFQKFLVRDVAVGLPYVGLSALRDLHHAGFNDDTLSVGFGVFQFALPTSHLREAA
jgi:hypothetical protein